MKKFKKPEFKLIKEFKKFITKGNVVDLAVGMIIGAAFTAIVNALVNNIFKPLINAIPLGGVEGLVTMLVEKNADGLTAAQIPAGTEFIVDLTKSVYIDWGAFIMAVVNFLLTAVVLFAIIKLMNKFRDGMGGMKNKAELVASLTDAEKATCKNPLIPTKKYSKQSSPQEQKQRQPQKQKPTPPQQQPQQRRKQQKIFLRILGIFFKTNNKNALFGA